MESDDDYESFSFPNDQPSPSPSPKHRRLKRLKKSSTVVPDQPAAPVESMDELIDLPRVDFASLEALESSDIRAFDDSTEPLSSQSPEDAKKASEVEESFGDGEDGEEKDDSHVNSDRKVRNRDLDLEEDLNDDDDDDEMENKLGSGDTPKKADRKVTKRLLEFDDEINGNGVDQLGGNEGENIEMKTKEVDDGVMNEKKGKKKRFKSSSEDPKAKTNKRREEKERKAHLEQLHAESQRLLRETRGAAFKPVPLVQKPISSILERIRQRKLEMSKKFCQPSYSESVKEYDGCLKEAAIDHSKSLETEVGDLPESVKEEKVSSVLNGKPGPDVICKDGPESPDECGEEKSCDNASSQMALDEEPTPVFRAPVNDTEELFDDCETIDSKESEDEEAHEQTISSQEEEMGPSLLTMKLKLDSAPDDISDEEENDKENVEPHVDKHAKECSSPKGDPVKAFVDDEAEEEDDSDNDRMRFGDEEEDEDDGDTEELRKMIATGYVEKPIDKEARNELHQKWLEEKDAAGTDDLLRRLNVASKLREASLLDDDEEGEEDVEPVDDDVEEDIEEDVERPKVPRMNSKKAKEIIAQMFTDKDEGFLSSDDEETDKLLARRCLYNKVEEKGKLVSPVEDEDSKEVFGLIKKLNVVPETRKKAKPTSFFDTMLTGGNSNSSSKSSFLSRGSNHSVPVSSKQGSTAVRSFIFGRDDSNSRSSISISEDTTDTTSIEIQTKKATTTNNYRSSQSQARSSSQTTKVGESSNSSSSSSSLFEILKRTSSMQSDDENNVVELSQSVFAAFKIPKKPVKIQGRV
ncbi:hypothetical protein OSB04_005200 [Centaurea solstitialis]|uniref:Uncharacterized protein n=1 Tax=Centaurea solstitialis TaxID=347529 RepID=A0AA38TFJ0_9ASTR|nr:hypothetical protein OSB04_005200 [Centaurea solstitialis]